MIRAVEHLKSYPASMLDRATLSNLREELEEWQCIETLAVNLLPPGQHRREYEDLIAGDMVAVSEALTNIEQALREAA